MPYKKEEDDDLFEDDFEFVDDDDEEEDEYEDEEDGDEEDPEVKKVKKKTSAPKRGSKAEKAPREAAPKTRAKAPTKSRTKSAADKPTPIPPVVDEEIEGEDVAAEAADAPEVSEPAGPPQDHVVHIYEFRKFKRTINREFTSEDADKFAAEFNHTSSNLSRWAVSGGKDDKPSPKI